MRTIEVGPMARSAAIALIGLSTCSCGSPTSSDTLVAIGPWGGEHALVTVNAADATIEFDCAHGAIPAPLAVHHGAFDVAGDFFPEHGGPIRVDEPVIRRPARYSGTIDGPRMTLRVTLTDASQDVGTFALTFGAAAHVFKCL